METEKKSRGVFITGGASGLGKAIALKFASEGWRVCIGDINDAVGEQARSEIEDVFLRATKGSAVSEHSVLYVHCNVCKQEDVDAVRDTLVDQWGGVEVVVNNAGVGGTAAVMEAVDLEDWQWIIDINLLGPVRVYRSFATLLKNQRSGHVVNIASAAGLMNAPQMGNYNATKAAVVSLAETMRFELDSFGVGVSVVCPGFFPTGIAESVRGAGGKANVSFVKKIEKSMQLSNIKAEHVAKDIYAAVENKTFWVLPHKLERRLWLLKRYMPEAFYKLLLKKLSNLR